MKCEPINLFKKPTKEIEKTHRPLAASEDFKQGDLLYAFDGCWIEIDDSKDLAKKLKSNIVGSMRMYRKL